MKGRLFSLDVLRGLDMLLLVVIGPALKFSHEAWHWCAPGFIRQFQHGWQGFTLWDIIMPLFIFMCGAAIPLALKKRLEAGPGVFWKHVIVRVVMLWCLGGLVQGSWATLDPLKISWFSNTLQSIATGYLVTAALMFTRRRWLLIAAAVGSALAYTLLLAWGGDYSQFGNAAFKLEFPIFQLVYPVGHVRLTNPSYYTWIPTSLMFVFMTLCGYFATEILKSALSQWQKAGWLFAYAAGLVVLGFATSPFIPIIKPIFTLSFTALAMGWSVLALAVLYVVCDIWQLRKGWGPAIFFGQLALTAYFVSHFFRPVMNAFGRLIAQGLLPHLAPGAQNFVVELFAIAGVIIVMYVWRELKVRRQA